MTSDNLRSLPSRGRRLSGLSCSRLPYPAPPTLTSVTSFWNLFQTFHLLLSPYLWDRPRVKNIENRYTEERLRRLRWRRDTCTLKLAINFPSFRLKALIVFRPLFTHCVQNILNVSEPVVVKDKLVCLVEYCKYVKDSFRHLHEQLTFGELIYFCRCLCFDVVWEQIFIDQS